MSCTFNKNEVASFTCVSTLDSRHNITVDYIRFIVKIHDSCPLEKLYRTINLKHVMIKHFVLIMPIRFLLRELRKKQTIGCGCS